MTAGRCEGLCFPVWVYLDGEPVVVHPCARWRVDHCCGCGYPRQHVPLKEQRLLLVGLASLWCLWSHSLRIEMMRWCLH
ncbi:hypothetical protein FKM82_026047 [Ascaphus truei]